MDYVTGAVLSAILLLGGIFQTLFFLRNAYVRKDGKYKLIVLPGDISAWSLGYYIVISEKDYENNRTEIMLHEQAHREKGHAFDLALLTAAQIVFWFNPVIHLLKHDLREIHEFQADDHVLKRGVEITEYQLLLIRKSVGERKFALATSFNRPCSTKSRIAMMNRSEKQGTARWKVLFYLPLFALLLFLFSSTSTASSRTEDTANPAPSDLSADESLRLPQGWLASGTAPQNYRMGVNDAWAWNGKNGGKIATIRSNGQIPPDGFGTLTQIAFAEKYKGKRVRMSGYMKSKDVADWAGFWFRVNTAAEPNKPLAFDNMQNRAVKGDTDWKRYEIVLDVPQNASQLTFGALLSGSGQIWFADLSFETVGDDVPTTDLYKTK